MSTIPNDANPSFNMFVSLPVILNYVNDANPSFNMFVSLPVILNYANDPQF